MLVQKVALEMFSKVIMRSPVDTGRFRGNWQVGIGNVPAGTLDLNDGSGTATVNRATAEAMGVKAGDTISLVNNLPYGPRLEDGWSGQAPAGMVGLTVQEFQAVVRKIGLELVQI
ncbi:HK97 gp10 family phage protein [uncultured Maritimibacter sp.]|nr:hypothetical protein [Maritimibacter sp.]